MALTSQITDTIKLLPVPPGDMAVLVQTRKDLQHYSTVLSRAGIPHVDPRNYDGISSDRVKIGTFKRAKGLEFKLSSSPASTPGRSGNGQGRPTRATGNVRSGPGASCTSG